MKTTAAPDKTHVSRSLKHDRPVISCRFSPLGDAVFFGAQDANVWRWTLDGDVKVPLAGHQTWVKAFCSSADGQTLVSGGYDGQLIWWPARDAKPAPARRVDAHHGWIRAVAISPDQKHLASAGNDLVIKIWNLADGTLQQQLKGHERHIYNLAFHPDSQHLASNDLMGNVFDWDLSAGKLARKIQLKAMHKYDPTFKADIGGARGIAFRPDGKQLACSGITKVTNAFAGVGNPIVEVVDWEAGKAGRQHTSKGNLRGVGWAVAYHPDGYIVALSGGGGGGFLLFWKPDQDNEFHQFKLPNTARDMDLSPDGLQLVTGHYDGQLRLCRMEPPKKK